MSSYRRDDKAFRARMAECARTEVVGVTWIATAEERGAQDALLRRYEQRAAERPGKLGDADRAAAATLPEHSAVDYPRTPAAQARPVREAIKVAFVLGLIVVGFRLAVMALGPVIHFIVWGSW